MRYFTFAIRKSFWGLIADRISWSWWEVEGFALQMILVLSVLAILFGGACGLTHLLRGNPTFDGMCIFIHFCAIFTWITFLIRDYKKSSLISNMLSVYIIGCFFIFWLNSMQYFQIVHILGLDYNLLTKP